MLIFGKLENAFAVMMVVRKYFDKKEIRISNASRYLQFEIAVRAQIIDSIPGRSPDFAGTLTVTGTAYQEAQRSTKLFPEYTEHCSVT